MVRIAYASELGQRYPPTAELKRPGTFGFLLFDLRNSTDVPVLILLVITISHILLSS